MKSNALPSFYFSAYPLKALNLQEEENLQSSSKNSLLKVRSLRVLPMTNPYPLKSVEKVERPDNDWFGNYE